MNAAKETIRKRSLKTRDDFVKALSINDRTAIFDKIYKNLEKTLPPAPAVVASYWPMGCEVDLRPVMDQLLVHGYTVALPVTKAQGSPLSFRAWHTGDRLTTGAFKTMEPLPTATPVVPQVILVPLLAFDNRGFRIGYGAGLYDRTLETFRKKGSLKAVGIALETQHLNEIPISRTDQALDAVVTEDRVYAFQLA